MNLTKLHNLPSYQIIFWFSSLLLFTFLLYQQGFNSPFIFDDIPNLNPMGKHQHLGLWNDIGLFILQGDSGPTGRPLSLVSFYLNDTAWNGTSAIGFKYTNVMLHLLNGVLIFWLAIKLTELTRLPKANQRYAIAILTTTIWLLHPIQINTVLYVVQRMTELSTLFMLTGLLSYLQGRQRLKDTAVIGWLWLLFGGGLSLFLSVISKETGVLLVVYILAIEYTLIRPFLHKTPKHFNKGLGIVVWFPALLLVAYLLKIGLNPNNYEARPFDVVQRLLTQSRVFWEYLNSILLPSPGKSSLFHDDFTISQHWSEPLTTLPAVLGIFALCALAVIIRRKQPVITFAIAWFLGGHLLESTIVPLEIYFEHRNYLPLLGPAFALAWYSQSLPAYWNRAGQTLIMGFILTAVATTHHGIVQWTKPVEMVAGWLQDHPRSQRTLEALDMLIGERISNQTRQQFLEELRTVSQETNTSSYLIFRDLQLACQKEILSVSQLQSAAQNLQTAGYVNSTSKAYADFIAQWLDGQCDNLDAKTLLSFNGQLLNMSNLQHGDMRHTLHYWQAEIQVKQGNLDGTMHHLEQAYQLKPSLDQLFIQAYYLSSAGLHTEALNKLERVEQNLCVNWRDCMILRLRKAEVDQLTELLKKRLQVQQEASAHDNTIDYSARKERSGRAEILFTEITQKIP